MSVEERKWVLTVGLFVSLLSGCNRQGHLTRVGKQMTWECAPEHYMSQYPDAQPVRLRYVEDPHYEEVISGRDLCDQLKGSGKTVVLVQFEAWGNSNGLVGYREISVDGKAIVNAGGWGSSGATNPVGPHPLEKLFKTGSGTR